MPIPFIAPLLASKAAQGFIGFFTKITLKQWLYIAAAVALTFAGYKGYHWVYNKGVQSQQAEIASLKAKNQELNATFTQWKQDTAEADRVFKAKQAELTTQLKADLAAANERANNRKVEYREIVKYITAADDAACVIPINFGLLHNFAIEGYPPGALDQLSDSASGVQTAPSTLTLSQYAAVAQNNGSEAVRRGEVILQWERWFDASKEQFTEAQRQAAQAIMGASETGTIRPDGR